MKCAYGEYETMKNYNEDPELKEIMPVAMFFFQEMIPYYLDIERKWDKHSKRIIRKVNYEMFIQSLMGIKDEIAKIKLSEMVEETSEKYQKLANEIEKAFLSLNDLATAFIGMITVLQYKSRGAKVSYEEYNEKVEAYMTTRKVVDLCNQSLTAEIEKLGY